MPARHFIITEPKLLNYEIMPEAESHTPPPHFSADGEKSDREFFFATDDDNVLGI